MFSAHVGVEVSHGGVDTFGVAGAPFDEEADGETAEHAKDPDGVSVSDTAEVFVGGCIESLMEAVFDDPVFAVGGQPLGGVEIRRFAAGQQPDGFGVVGSDMAVELGGLLGVREADPFRRHRPGMDLPAFPAPAVAFVAPSHGGRRRLRGKRPPERQRRASGRFVRCPVGCP